ncbi:hypothetical protein ROZALSC1DRAFT_18485, partial [Rozella allomycis CSF55]
MVPDPCDIYVDDVILKGSKIRDETFVRDGIRQFMFDHIMDIDRILAKLDFANFTLNGYKAFFCVPEVTILSYVCNQDGR